MSESVGSRLKRYRKSKGWTLEQTSEITGVPLSSLSEIELDKHKPTYDKLEAIIRFTDINPYWLILGDGEMIRLKDKPDQLVHKILLLIQDMDEERRKEVFRYTEEKKLLKELLEKQDKRDKKTPEEGAG